ncbi:hypothetical protein N7448_002296 [Penicillium atrosanguineum]|uniref:Acyltransferase 3 domain-containing protein n=1 Tax=Penicillium atrosanguineum TaxID=1132637 RepID=A0A9W9HE64_9EURO|nr:Chitin synthase A [Penicillium atrosanguineum]KAJ5128579.1 hypothetical protein N7526_006745 [Penicillium atrosanguineum]KAJ5144904.1 hypothetical protein N7448_002296 [Penicillium atrosanguineum]KAJ5300698.1 Chitin synthase A [Penicillium atrosanguineum]KAJ5311339.1 hypothetical protein N7476_007199 [Penicillium atrosanguineum]
MAAQKRADNWIDGLRGVAALTVVTYHLCSCFANWLNSPAISEEGSVYIFQYPFLRLVVAGRSAVALFFLLTGYVNSFNSRKHIRNGDAAFALQSLARSTLTRTGRLVMPTTAAVLMVWLICQLNGFRVASQVDAGWIRGSGTTTSGPTFFGAIDGLLRNLILFWHNGVTDYDHTYWTIPFFLKGSMLVYITLLGTTYTQPRHTKLILISLYFFAWSGGQALMEMNIYAGIFLAELHADYGTNATTFISRPTSTLMIIFGLFLASFPEENPSWMPWSQALNTVGHLIVPNGGEVNRYITSLGTTFFVFGVFFSRDARRLLSSPFMNFLGRISFPIYLIHNTLIRTVLSLVLYQQSIVSKGMHPVDKEGNPMFYEVGGAFTFAVTLPLFYLLLIYVAHLWTIHVDPRCGRVVSWLSRKAFGDTSDSELTKESPSNGILTTWKGRPSEPGKFFFCQ